MEKVYNGVLIEEDGVLVNEAEIIDPLTESHLKIKLVRGRVYVRVVKRRLDVGPRIDHTVLLPGQSLSGNSTRPRLVVRFPPLVGDESTVKVEFLVTWSPALLISFRLRILLGDLVEEYGDKRSRMGTQGARLWLLNQVARSIVPVCWQIIRYDLIPSAKSWLLWSGRLEPRNSSAHK